MVCSTRRGVVRDELESINQLLFYQMKIICIKNHARYVSRIRCTAGVNAFGFLGVVSVVVSRSVGAQGKLLIAPCDRLEDGSRSNFKPGAGSSIIAYACGGQVAAELTI